MQGYLDSMRRYFVFNGRSSPSQYWSFVRVIFGVSLLITLLDAFLFRTNAARATIQLVALIHFIPMFALAARRLHDAGKTGWFALLLVIPIINIVVWIVIGRLKPITSKVIGDPSASAEPTAAHTTQNASSTVSTIERLEKLAQLRASGVIDDVEFQRLKADTFREADQ